MSLLNFVLVMLVFHLSRHLLPESLEELSSNEGKDINRRLLQVRCCFRFWKQLFLIILASINLQMDLRNIGSGWIPVGLRKNKSGKVETEMH